MTANTEILTNGIDWDQNWEKLMQDNSWEFDGLVDTNYDFEGLEGWLTHGHEPQSSVDNGTSRDQCEILSPPLYAGFVDLNVVRSGNPEQCKADDSSSVTGMQTSIQALQLELKEKTRQLDNLHRYIEELQPWTQEVSKSVKEMLDKQAGLTTFDVDHIFSDQQGSLG